MPEGISLYVAIMAMRLLAGILFCFQGYDKLFHLKTSGVVNAFADTLAQKNIPIPFARTLIFISSFIEFGGGLLLVLGLFHEPVLYFLLADLLCVAIAFSYLKPMWDMGFYFPRFILLIILLLIPADWDTFSLAQFFR